MPVKRRTRVPRRGRRTSFRKRRLTRRRRLVARYKKRKNVSRRTRLTQGFPRTAVTTLKYVDNVTDISPHTDANDETGKNAPGILAFSCNDPGRPDLGSISRSDFPIAYAVKGAFPHQPLGYDQYTLLYQNAKVLRSSAKFTLTFATRDGYAMDLTPETSDAPTAPATQFDSKGTDTVQNHPGTTGAFNSVGVPTGTHAATSVPVAWSSHLYQRFPAGLYVGIVRVNSFNPLALPQRYSEFLERFKAPLKWVPYMRQQAGFKTVTLYGLYGAPSEKFLRSQVKSEVIASHQEDRMADMLTLKNGDVPFTYQGNTYIGRSGCRHAPPQAQFAWQVVVYYPDESGHYVIANDQHSNCFCDAVSMRATVNIRYRVRFTKPRMLRQSFLTSTPGINEQFSTPEVAGHGLPQAGGGTAIATSTDGIIDQSMSHHPENQKGLGHTEHEEIPQL